MEIVQKKVSDLIPYINNTRTHDEKQVTQIASSIKEFGFTNPVLIGKDNDVIAGHGRIMAAKKLKMDEVPAIELGHLTETQKKAYVIADNKLAENSDWDMDKLKIELENLQELDFDIDLLGFDEKELDKIAGIENTSGTQKDLSDDVEGFYEVVVTCEDEEEQEMVYNKFKSEGYTCRILTL